MDLLPYFSVVSKGRQASKRLETLKDTQVLMRKQKGI